MVGTKTSAKISEDVTRQCICPRKPVWIWKSLIDGEWERKTIRRHLGKGKKYGACLDSALPLGLLLTIAWQHTNTVWFNEDNLSYLLRKINLFSNWNCGCFFFNSISVLKSLKKFLCPLVQGVEKNSIAPCIHEK